MKMVAVILVLTGIVLFGVGMSMRTKQNAFMTTKKGDKVESMAVGATAGAVTGGVGAASAGLGGIGIAACGTGVGIPAGGSNTNSVGSTSFTPMTAMKAVYKVAEKKSSALTVTGFIDRLSHKAIKDFEVSYELQKASNSWNLVINLSSGGSPAINYLVQMDETGSVMKEKMIEKTVNLDGLMSDRQQTKKIQKKEKRGKKTRGNLRDELLTVSVKQQSLLSGSAGMTKDLDFFTNGVLRTEFSIPHDEKVVTFFQLPVFASTMNTVASAGLRLRCVHEGKPHPVILKRELTKDGYRIDVYKDDFIDSEQSKRIIQCVYSNHEGFSFPDEIALEIDDTTISVQKQANKELTNE